MDGTRPTEGVTRDLARWIADPRADPPTPRAITAAKHALLDWTGVAIAGAAEPLTKILIGDALQNGEAGACPVVGTAHRTSPAFAAMINGAASHALDYDDVNTLMRGHPSVAVIPALLSAAHGRAISGRAFLEAFIAGTEAACIVGEMLGAEHYERGFHTTATVGTIAAAAGVARLMELSPDQAAHALGLAATQAAGLQTSFGTMAKPLHAGKAAMNGLLSARLASMGFTASTSALEGGQGFGATQSVSFRPLPVRPDVSAPFGIERNVYKYHAACYYTHSAIECALALKDRAPPTEIKQVTIRLSSTPLQVCDNAAPTTGLEVKFSIRHLVAMALMGYETARADLYTAELAKDPALTALRTRIQAQPHEFDHRMASDIRVALTSGEVLEHACNVGIPAADLEDQRHTLTEKFHLLCSQRRATRPAQDIAEAIDGFDDLKTLDGFFSFLGRTAHDA